MNYVRGKVTRQAHVDLSGRHVRGGVRAPRLLRAHVAPLPDCPAGRLDHIEGDLRPTRFSATELPGSSSGDWLGGRVDVPRERRRALPDGSARRRHALRVSQRRRRRDPLRPPRRGRGSTPTTAALLRGAATTSSFRAGTTYRLAPTGRDLARSSSSPRARSSCPTKGCWAGTRCSIPDVIEVPTPPAGAAPRRGPRGPVKVQRQRCG